LLVEGYVYLCNIIGSDRYKIGMTRSNPSKRKKSLQTCAPGELYMVHIVKSVGCNLVERAMHRMYKSRNTIGEWFEFEPEEECDVIMNMEKCANSIQFLKDSGNHYINKI
jgi:hypothetical protein